MTLWLPLSSASYAGKSITARVQWTELSRFQTSNSDDSSMPTNYEVPQLSFQSTTTRRGILISYWVVILAALPLWWYTTAIERLSLPRGKVENVVGRKVSSTIFGELWV